MQFKQGGSMTLTCSHTKNGPEIVIDAEAYDDEERIATLIIDADEARALRADLGSQLILLGESVD